MGEGASRICVCVLAMARAVLKKAFNDDVASLVLEHKAAMVIQSFFRRSQYFVLIESDAGESCFPNGELTMRHALHAEHERSKFEYDLKYHHRFLRRCERHKPLKTVLSAMMHIVIREKASYLRRSRKARLRPYYFKVTLKKTSRYGPLEQHRRGLPIVTVTDKTAFKFLS